MTTEEAFDCDVAVVGAGPAGLAAAAELRRLGAGRVVVLERETTPGGIPRHCGHSPYGLREFARLLRGPEYAARLVERALAAGVEVRAGISVTAIGAGGRLAFSAPEGLGRLRARRILLATGAREKSRAQRFIGGTRPGGVLSTGALQAMVYLEGLTPFRRPVVLGSEFVSFSALLTCRHAGIRPVAMVEPGPRVLSWRGSSLLPRLLGVPLLLGTDVTRVLGGSRVEAVEVRGPDGVTRLLEADGLLCTGQFLPEASLALDSGLMLDPASGGPEVDQFGRLSDPAVFAAGNLLRPVETAGWSWSEGRAAARWLARSLDQGLPEPVNTLRVRIGHPALKYVLPQRLVPADTPERAGARPGPHDRLQLRVNRPLRGRLLISHEGRVVHSQRLAALPERRVLVPRPVLPRGATGTLVFSVQEDAD